MTADREYPPVIIMGAGGHAAVVLDLLRLLDRRVIGTVAPTETALGTLPWLGADFPLADWHPEEVDLANGIGSIRPGSARVAVFKALRAQGYRFATLIHPRATIAKDVVIGMGTLICAGAVVQTGSTVGENVILNTGSHVDHDCRIESDVHISPGAVLCGGVTVGGGSHVGAGSTIVQGIRIGPGAMIAAGAVVVRDIPANTMAVGVPARLKH